VSWSDNDAGYGHWRTHDGDEVDLILERDDGCIVAFEVKSGSRISSNDLSGLRKLYAALGDKFVGGIVLNTGERSYMPEDRIHVFPIDRLWTPSSVLR
jgi:predicted AAA+ superfamily ATPase